MATINLKPHGAVPDLWLEQLREQLTASEARESAQQEARARLRDYATALRDPMPSTAQPGSLGTQSFKLSPASHFKGAVLPGGREEGHLPGAARAEFLDHLKEASKHLNNPERRDTHVQKAARVAGAAHDAHTGLTSKQIADHPKESLIHMARQEARSQMMFISREIGEKLGISPQAASVVGYSLERALEREGFRVVASHAIDKVSDVFKASTSAVAATTGLRQSLDQQLGKSVTWLADHGITKATIKDFVGKHSGKLVILSELASSPELLARATYLISKSDKVVDGIIAAASDKELRKAIGNVAMASGEALSAVPGAKGLGSISVVGGAMLKGESPSETGRHIFRAAASIVGGALGGVAGGAVSAGFGAVGGAVVGSELGSRVADKLMEIYDRQGPREQAHAPQPLVSKDELKNSAHVIQERVGTSIKGAAADGLHRMPENVRELARERGMSNAGPRLP